MIICVVVLEHAFLTNDFSFNVVATHSSVETPTFYKVTAMWSSQEGSLLLWAFILSIVSTISLAATRHKLRDLVPWATAVMMGIATFFTGLMLLGGEVNPFATISPVPLDGTGLNPLLQHPSMIIHPPMLYTGYVSLTVPFAFAIGALVSRRVDAAWIKSTRGFALIAWTFLSIGIVLGARWSYTELGWGGYWAWDPVENASVMPWLITTAYIHSIMVQEKRGMLKVWNASLIVASFSLALLGTFLVRSGVLQSIHAFGDSTVGPYFLSLIGVVLLGSTWLIISRLDILRSDRRIDSLASREAVFVINNLLLIALCAVVFWGTFFPIISELLTGTRSTLAAPWFDRYTTPVAVILVLFTGIGPMLSWRRISWEGAKRVFTLPLIVGAIAFVLLLLLTDAAHSFWALAIFTLAAFTITALFQETWRAAAARRRAVGGSIPGSIWSVATRNRHRYGGYVVHLGLVVLLVGIAASSSFQTKRDVELTPGQSAVVDDYTVTYVKPTVSRNEQALIFGADLQVDRNGKQFAELNPTRQFHQATDGRPRGVASYFEGEATSEVGLEAGLRSDFWTSVEPNTNEYERRAKLADGLVRAIMMVNLKKLGNDPSQADSLAKQATVVVNWLTDVVVQGPDAIAQLPTGVRRVVCAAIFGEGAVAGDRCAIPEKALPVTIRVIVSPMVTWIWIGAIIAVIGALFAVWPSGLLKRKGAA